MRILPIIWLAICMFSDQTIGDVYVSVELHEFKNVEGRKMDGSCCDITGTSCAADACDQIFNVCLDNSTSTGCPSGYTKFDIPANQNSFSFPQNSTINAGSSYNPTTFKLTKWTGSTTLKMVVFDSDSDSQGAISLQIVDILIVNITQARPDRSQDLRVFTDMSMTGLRDTHQTTMTIRVAIFCNNNYFGAECSTYCVAAHSCSGHFTCDPDSGSKICMDGWQGQDCTVASSGMSTCPAKYVTVTPPVVITVVVRAYVSVSRYTHYVSEIKSVLTTPNAHNLDMFVGTSPCETIDLVFIVDNSGTISELNSNNWSYMLNFMKTFTDLLTISPAASQIGVVVYGNNGVLRIKLNDHGNDATLKSAIDQLVDHKQKTNTIDSLKVTLEQGFSASNGARPSTRRIAIMITDGEKPNSEYGDPLLTASSLRDAGIDTFVITLDHFFNNGETNKDLVEKIASLPLASHLYILTNFTQMHQKIPAHIIDIVKSSCIGSTLPMRTTRPIITTLPTRGPPTVGKPASTILPTVRIVKTTIPHEKTSTFVFPKTTLPVGLANGDVPITTLPPVSIEGTWEGEYNCSDSKFIMMATIVITSQGDKNKLTGTLSFSNSTVNGVINVQVEVSSGNTVTFTPYSFKIQPPAGINLLGLTGSVDSTFKSISGSTINQNCGTFNLRRTATGYCKNGGSCIRYGHGVTDVYCCCTKGYTGSYCEVEINPCVEVSCGLGTCVPTNGTHHTCTCPDGYSGDDCNIIVVDITCINSPCLNNGTCKDTSSGINCTCLPSFTGVQCETEIVTPVPCPEFYYGLLCTTRCRQADTCDRGHYSCDQSNGSKICNSGFSGTDCKVSPTDCNSRSTRSFNLKTTSKYRASTTGPPKSIQTTGHKRKSTVTFDFHTTEGKPTHKIRTTMSFNFETTKTKDNTPTIINKKRTTFFRRKSTINPYKTTPGFDFTR